MINVIYQTVCYSFTFGFLAQISTAPFMNFALFRQLLEIVLLTALSANPEILRFQF